MVTGGLGFIGQHFVRHLLERPEVDLVLIVDELWSGHDPITFEEFKALAKSDPRLVIKPYVNYGDRQVIGHLLEKHRIDGIVHLAAETHVDRSYDDPIGCFENNVLGLIRFLQATVDYGFAMDGKKKKTQDKGLKIFVHMSTDEIYGDRDPRPADEGRAPDPTNPYSASKVAAEMVVRVWQQSYGLPVSIVRCNNAYGPFQAPDKMIPKFIRAILDGNPVTIHGTGEQRRNWIHVSDICRALYLIGSSSQCIGRTYNLSTDDECSVREMAERLFRAVFAEYPQVAPLTTVNVTDRPHNDRFYHIDSSLLRNELGWRPTITLEDGIASTVRLELERISHR